ncbi:hypothetical protein BKA61DRAFT_647526 [Leptodontidium sp. MPI-SDFR-AT-0119]|nr:hypothetical protein BKA61DRAFT_647526 [Leptodontidium sp. MPI-SDFR-AT-0119]
MIPFDFIAQKNAQEAEHGFIRKIVEAKHEIMSFVNNRLGWNEAREFLNYFKGSFNLSIAVKNAQTDELYEPWRERKVKNEVMIMNYLSEYTSIPIPRIYHWGFTEEGPQQLGPFMIEEFMEGESLADPAVLDLDINEAKLDIIYEQIASFMLELSRLEFPRIGAISNVSGEWVVAEPPLTYDMNEVVGFTGFPADYFTTLSSFTCSSDYFAARAHCLQAHLETQRNIAFEDEDITWNRYIARYCFGKLIPARSTVDDSRPFRIFCDDLRPSNMLVDPKTMRITALLDFEFTDEFLDLFEPRKEQFLHAMERVEAKSAISGEPRLSARMRESWDSKRFWFNLASRSSFDIDQIFWEVLYQEGLGEVMLDTATLAGKEEFLKRKKNQFKAYWAEKQNDARFNK